MENRREQSSYNYIRQVDFKSKTATKDKEGHFIMLTKSIHQEDITIYAPTSIYLHK